MPLRRNNTLLALVTIALLTAGPAQAVDHNNLDANRPLTFDDAGAIAFREQALEIGLALGWARGRSTKLGLSAEYLYGFSLNSHLSIGFAPAIGGQERGSWSGVDPGDVSVGLFHNFNREHGRTPALALRADLAAPTGDGSRGVAFRLRGIASRQADQYGRVHLNLDLEGNPGAPPGDREFRPGVVLGYSRPLGYPTSFSTTGLAEISIRAGERFDSGGVLGVGIGLRRQVGVRSVMDLGIQSDLAGWKGAARDRVRLVAGYSYSF